MKSHTRHILTTSIVLGALAVGGGVFAWSGLYNIAADDAHTPPVYSMLQMLRERSITARAHKLHPPPNLDDAARIRQGAGNYDAMCTSCHLAPGMQATELSMGLYPSPPDLSKAAVGDASHHFWVIKHGIKASGMPAWGKSMGDEYIWNMVAFLQQLPSLDAKQYQALVATSGGHAHGGGETMAHDDGAGMADHHAKTPAGMVMDESKPHPHAAGTPADHHPPSAAAKAAPATVEHRHADGTLESHPAPAPPQAEDGHDHQH